MLRSATTLPLLSVLGLTVPVPAQSEPTLDGAIVFAMDGNERTLDGAGGLAEAALLREDEVGFVFPTPQGGYSASPFLTTGAQWAFLGDADQDGRYADASTTGPGDDSDAVFVKRVNGPSTFGPRDVFFSKEGDAGFASGFEDGDVFRYASQGTLEVFVTEAQLLVAIGQSATADLDLDAICQSMAGDLFVSFSLDEMVGGVLAEDGAIVYIPAAAISYDANGNVGAIAGSSAAIVANEADVNAMIANSGVRTSVGGTPTTSIDLSALELDPDGGVWNPPQNPSLTLPNLLFAWSGFSNDGAILTTAGNGSIAMINSTPMGSTTATLGTQIGLLPDSTGLGGLMGIGLIPTGREPVVVENHPTNLITSSTILFTRQEVSGATPGGQVFVLVDFGPTAVGGSLPVLDLGSLGDLFGIGFLTIVGTTTADTGGHASVTTIMPSTIVGSGANLAWQVFDAGLATLGAPAAMQFL